MSKNRYGRIYHSNHSYINLRFESLDKRRVFEAKFNAYHAEHDHDGEAPRFEEISASEAGGSTYDSSKCHDAHSVSIDGYATYEIEEYHDDPDDRYHRYRPPTCCVAPIISIKRKFVASDSLERHDLSAIFGDMPENDYTSLLESIEKDGFIDPVIRILDHKVLDGWHRYRAAKQLNLLRKLRFQPWHTDDHRDGDPRVFVYARNIDRRHLDKATRAQIAIAFNERFGMGRPKGDEKVHQNDELKSREQLAKDLDVSTSTIDRAIVIEKEGQSEAVISGKKTAGEVLKERDVAKLVKRKKQVIKNIWDMRVQAARDYTGDGDTEMNEYLTLPELEKGFAKSYESYQGPFESAMKRIDAAVSFENFQERCLDVDEFGNAKFNIEDLEKEYRALMTYGGDLRNWQRADWSPDTNWILPLIEVKKEDEQKQKKFTSMVNALDRAVKIYDKNPALDSLTFTELEEAFARSHENIADDFRSGIDRIESSLTGNVEEVIEIALKADVKLFLLEAECKAISIFAHQISEWKDQDWILPLIEAKKKAKAATAEADRSPSVSDLWDKIEKNTQAIRAAYTEVYQKGAVSVSEMFTAGITYYNLPKEGLELSLDNPTGGYEDEKRLTRIEGVTARMLSDFTESRVKAGWIRKCLSGEAKIKMLWEQIASAISAWKSERKGQGVGHASKGMFLAATKRFHDLPRERETDVDLLEKLLSLLSEVQGPVYTFERYIKMQCDGASIWTDSESDEEISEDLPLQDALDEMKQGVDDVEYLKGVVNRSRMRFWRARERLTDFARVASADFAKAAVESLGLSQDATQYLFEGVEDPLLDLSVSELTCWQSRFDILTGQIEKEVGWVVEVMRLTSEDTEKSDALDKFKTQKADLYAVIGGTPLISVKDEFGFENADKARHGVMVAAHKAYDLSEDLLWSDQAIETLDAEEIGRITGLYYLMVQDLNASRADWVVKLYQEAKIPEPAESDASESTPNDNLVALAGSLMEDFDAHFEKLEVTGEAAYMDLFKKAAAHYSFDLTCFLYVTEMYDSVDYKAADAFWESLEQPQRHAWMNVLMSMQDDLQNRTNWAAGIDERDTPNVIETSDEPMDSAADTSLADLNLPSLKGILDTLVDTVGQVEHQVTRDNLSCAIYDVFSEQFEGVTEREQLSILLECAQSIVSESESNSFVKFIEGSHAGENESPTA